MGITAALFSVGDELLSGRTVNTNSAHVARQLDSAGIQVARGLTLPDEVDTIAKALREAREDLVIVTGGLGPTDDDVTVAGVAKALKRSLVEHSGQRQAIDRFFRARGKEAAPVNYRQALIPKGFEVLENDWGTAPCLWGSRGGKGHFAVALLPGVPREMRALMEHRVMPRVKSHFRMAPGHVLELRTAGIGESDLFQKVMSIPLPPGVRRAFLPDPGEVLVRFTGPSAAALKKLALVHSRRLSPHVVGLGGDSLESVILNEIKARHWTLALAESCTGGRVASRITATPGSSAVFHSGFVTYANDAKKKFLSVKESTLEKYGAVSEPVVREMVRGLLTKTGAQVGAAVSGLAGPGGATPEKPLGLVWIAVATPMTMHTKRFDLKGDRGDIQGRAAQECLRVLWEQVRLCPLPKS